MSNRTHSFLEYARVVARRNPAVYAALAYAILSLSGACLLSLSAMRNSGAASVRFVDALFIATSAVSTTGLVTLDPGSTFNLGGELVVLTLIQIGGVGFMTLMSFAYLALRDRLGPAHSRLARAGFGLSSDFNVGLFIRRVVLYTVLLEALGAAILAPLFSRAGVADPVWQGIFHSVSAFHTAGFSLFSTSLEQGSMHLT
jgi:trk system potassium uptake protein TrkH